MGNREDLLAGAKRCLYDKGYAQTTARDIASAAGVSLAAIGYHFGTKEALLQEAVLAALRTWGEDLGTIAASRPDRRADPGQQLAATWAGVLASFTANRPLWTIQFELLAHLDRSPELRQTFADANHGARVALVELFGHGDGLPAEEVLALGTFYQAMLGGVAAQWLVDPGAALSGADLVLALRRLGAVLAPASAERSATPGRRSPRGTQIRS